MANIKQFVCLGGLPRTGSTLLSAILSQNPEIHAEGNSAVCQIMSDIWITCDTLAKEQLTANNREHTKIDLIKEIPNIYYKGVTASVIVDKCRSWPTKDNQLLYRQLTANPKTIILTRPLEEIVKSFINLFEENGYTGNLEKRFSEIWSAAITHAIEGIKWAKQNNTGEFLFVSYDELTTDTEATIKKIYSFCEWKSFNHNFNSIVNMHPENDDVYQLKGMHDIRSSVSKRKLTTQLSPAMLKQCRALDI